MLARLTIPLLLAPLLACRADGFQRPSDSGDALDTAGTDDTEDDSTAETEEPAEPDFFSLGGTLAVADGDAETTGTSLVVGFWTGDELLCEVSVTPTGFTPATSTDETVELHGWWAVTWVDPQDPACAWPLPGDLHLGIGELDDRLYPAMAQSGLSTTASALYGLYAQYDDTPVYVYGVAGTSANFDGSATPVSQGPLPDGTYDLRTLHLLPLATAR